MTDLIFTFDGADQIQHSENKLLVFCIKYYEIIWEMLKRVDHVSLLS